jgi:hypothetical protein
VLIGPYELEKETIHKWQSDPLWFANTLKISHAELLKNIKTSFVSTLEIATESMLYIVEINFIMSGWRGI